MKWHGLWVVGIALVGFSWADPADFDRGWRFHLGEVAGAMMPAFDDTGWTAVDLPHDWSNAGPFAPEYGSGNGYAPGGIGWYRKSFVLPGTAAGRRVWVLFDGVYCRSEVWINGHYVGQRPSGYHSFWLELTPHVTTGAAANVLAVRVDHSRWADSRWYTGSGIYRRVHLRVKHPVSIPEWGVFVQTPQVGDELTEVRVQTQVDNTGQTAAEVICRSTVLGPDGDRPLATVETRRSLAAGETMTFDQPLTLQRPRRWSPDSPTLYRLRSEVLLDGEVIDREVTPFGVRSFRFDPNRGFFLNGRPMTIKGVCLHHDAGALGAAVPEAVWRRRLERLKELGVNAIRTSHNPPAPELLDLCDRMGFLVKDEAFDEFTPPKNKWVQGWNQGQPSRMGYGEVFEQWAVRDLQDQVRRDRNHPSVILWSIGNEIDYANDPFSHPVLGDEYRPTHPPAERLVSLARPLVAAVKALDTTRPVTAALANVPMSNAVGLPDCLDVVGYNYQERLYAEDHARYPDRVIFGSENGDSYAAWRAVVDNDFIAGQFLWTGIDYLGEAGRWPTRANGAGLLDLCGFKKPIAWYRQSLWSDEPMVYACVRTGRGGRRGGLRGREAWVGRDGQAVDVQIVSNCPEVELRLNGQSLGRRPMTEAEAAVLRWTVPAFTPGRLDVVGWRDGRAVARWRLNTPGPARRWSLVPERSVVVGDGRDVCHVVVRVVDADGHRVDDSRAEAHLRLTGPVRLLGMGNADLRDVTGTLDTVHPVYQGRGLIVLQSEAATGPVTLELTGADLEPATVQLEVVEPAS